MLVMCMLHVKARFSPNAGVIFVNFYRYQLCVAFQVICIVRGIPVLLPFLCFIKDGSNFKQLISYLFFVIYRNLWGIFQSELHHGEIQVKKLALVLSKVIFDQRMLTVEKSEFLHNLTYCIVAYDIHRNVNFIFIHRDILSQLFRF